MAVEPAKAESYEARWNQANVIEAVQLWKLNPSDQQKFFVLQKKLQDVQHPWNDPHVVLGFVEAFGFPAAEQKFRKMIEWRLRNKVDSLLKEYHPNPLLMDHSPVAFLADYDHEGDPIYCERGGACDAKGLLKRFSKEQLMRHSIWLREVQSDGAWLDDYKEQMGRPVVSITVVYDLQGLCGRHLQPNVISFFQRLMNITEEYYPGPVKRVIVIRSPPIFRTVWAVVKHFFSEESRQKMIFANKDYSTLPSHPSLFTLSFTVPPPSPLFLPSPPFLSPTSHSSPYPTLYSPLPTPPPLLPSHLTLLPSPDTSHLPFSSASAVTTFTLRLLSHPSSPPYLSTTSTPSLPSPSLRPYHFQSFPPTSLPLPASSPSSAPLPSSRSSLLRPSSNFPLTTFPPPPLRPSPLPLTPSFPPPSTLHTPTPTPKLPNSTP
ncbi:SEC14-like protein [Seminavis robusta]|uniref:SEC14-like protein n=1 Tax=Seminavis robusta TaxID=568900 RepID=A0A9N8F1R9_9STRA|nr:SEC14-like protein [Seminavis robusta]|eukprot:Sro3223_g345530.1 SEC14-like protein (432) ;mRNA; f:5450-6745